MTDTIPTRAHLDHEAVLDALLAADMRNEAAVEFTGRTARSVGLYVGIFGAIGLPVICLIGVVLINLRWSL